nr:hypothetical protein Y68A4A.1 - Caenorhabditis elegans [Caenorhabditis elegans]
MNFSCIPDVNYFDSPQFLAIALHIVTVIVTPFHFLGLYCVLYKTPRQMKGVKWYLLNLHVSVMLFDYSVTLLTIPFLLATKLAGFSLGLAKYMNVPFIVPALTAVYCFGLMFIAIVVIFENRFRVICTFSWKPKWESFKSIFMPFHYFIYTFMLSIIFFLVPEQKSALQQVFQTLPCLPREIYEAPVYVIADDVTFHVIVIFLGVVAVTVEILFYLMYLIWNSIKQLKENKMSQKTFQLQKQFLIAIIVQSSVPMIFFIIPLLTFLFAFLEGYYNQGIVNFQFIIASLHGIVSTLAMLLLHKPYRAAVARIF